MAIRRVTPETLNSQVEFGCPFTVLDVPTGPLDGRASGYITDSDLYAPSVWHDEEDDIEIDGAEHWEALSGYTGQYSYNGAVMHPSETLSGPLARDILTTPGTYVVVAVEVMPTRDDENPEPAGWAVLRLK